MTLKLKHGLHHCEFLLVCHNDIENGLLSTSSILFICSCYSDSNGTSMEQNTKTIQNWSKYTVSLQTGALLVFQSHKLENIVLLQRTELEKIKVSDISISKKVNNFLSRKSWKTTYNSTCNFVHKMLQLIAVVWEKIIVLSKITALENSQYFHSSLTKN